MLHIVHMLRRSLSAKGRRYCMSWLRGIFSLRVPLEALFIRCVGANVLCVVFAPPPLSRSFAVPPKATFGCYGTSLSSMTPFKAHP